MLKSKIVFKFTTLFILSSSYLNADNLGSLLFHGNCITCHNETKALSAPSIIDVKRNYLRAFPQKKAFVRYMSTWIINPNAESSIMLNAIKKYTLMPNLGFDKSTIEIISKYIYETDFTKEHVGHKEKKIY